MIVHELTYTSRLPDKFRVTWQLRSGATRTDEITAEQYANLGAKGYWQRADPIRPANAIGIVVAGQFSQYNTPSGGREINTITDQKVPGFIHIVLPEGKTQILTTEVLGDVKVPATFSIPEGKIRGLTVLGLTATVDEAEFGRTD